MGIDTAPSTNSSPSPSKQPLTPAEIDATPATVAALHSYQDALLEGIDMCDRPNTSLDKDGHPSQPSPHAAVNMTEAPLDLTAAITEYGMSVKPMGVTAKEDYDWSTITAEEYCRGKTKCDLDPLGHLRGKLPEKEVPYFSCLNAVVPEWAGYAVPPGTDPVRVFNLEDHDAFADACVLFGYDWEKVAHYMGRPQWVIACYGTFMFYLIGNEIVLGHILGMKKLGASDKQILTMVRNLYNMVQNDTWLPSFWPAWKAQEALERGEPIPDRYLQHEIIDSSASEYEASEAEQEVESGDDDEEDEAYGLSEEEDDGDDDSDWEEPRKGKGSSGKSKKKGAQQPRRGKKDGGSKRKAMLAQRKEKVGEGKGRVKRGGSSGGKADVGTGGKAQADRQSRFLGVHWSKAKKWDGGLHVDGKLYKTGRFEEEKEEECAKAYDRLVRKLIGDGCLTNFSEDGQTFLDPLGSVSGDDFRGLTLHDGRWFVKIKVNGKTVHGDLTFENTAEGKGKAAQAYDKLARKYHGAKAVCNFLPDGSRNPRARKRVFNTKEAAAQRVAERNAAAVGGAAPTTSSTTDTTDTTTTDSTAAPSFSSSSTTTTTITIDSTTTATITGKRTRVYDSDDDCDGDECEASTQQQQQQQQGPSGADAHDAAAGEAEPMVIV